MPVMLGTSLDTALEAAQELGLTRGYNDEDFGYGTKICLLTSSNSGLTLDEVYSASTKEALSGTIVTFNTLSSSDEQKGFIEAMVGVLCHERDKEAVANWVNLNVGGAEETTLNGFIYEVVLGLSGNTLYHSDKRNWEEWELSFN